MLYIVIAILIFGFLIAIHELGHFMAAKASRVKVNEFSVGMGPAIFRRMVGETEWSLRLFPVGGYCAMEGEDDDSSDPRAFGNAGFWKKILILVAGAGMNFLAGVLILLLLNGQAKQFVQPTVDGFLDGYGIEQCGLQTGDIVREIDGHAILTYGNLNLYLSRAGDDVDWVVERGGEKIRLENIHMPPQQRVDENGNPTYYRGLRIGTHVLPATTANKLRYTCYDTIDYVRLVWVSLGDLVTGHVGLQDLSGPVGIVNTVSQVGENSPTTLAAVWNIGQLSALIAVNLAVMNLLPLPALDGGRILFLVINKVFYTVSGRKLDPKYEGYVHMIGLAMLLVLMFAVTMSDIGKLFAG